MNCPAIIECLGERQPERRAALGSENGNVWVRRSLQSRHARAYDKHRREEKRKADEISGRHKQQRAHNLNEQRNHDRLLVADRFNQLCRRSGEDEVGEKERRLRQHCPRIGQREQLPQVWHQSHVQVGDESKQKK